MSVVWLRVACLVILLYCSVTVTWQTLLALGALIVAMLLPNTNAEPSSQLDLGNPLKGKPKQTLQELPDDVIRQVERRICEFVTYDAENVESLHNFEQIKQNTKCLFARRAKLWGSPEWKPELSLEENVLRCIPTFYKFSCLCEPLGLDGFLYELPEQHYGRTPEVLGESVRRVLTVLSDNDPAAAHCMDRSYIGGLGWVFEFDRVTMFITSFAPCYPDSHARYGYESDRSYILFQPEISFAQHDLPPDTPHTNWEEPRTVRDRIRRSFRDAGQPYHIRESLRFPMAWDMVKPRNDFEDPVIEWWVPPKALPNVRRRRNCPLPPSKDWSELKSKYHIQRDMGRDSLDLSTDECDIETMGSCVTQMLEQSVQRLHERAERYRSDALDWDLPSERLSPLTSVSADSSPKHISFLHDWTLKFVDSHNNANNMNSNNRRELSKEEQRDHLYQRTLCFLKAESLDSVDEIDATDFMPNSIPHVNGDSLSFQETDMFSDVDTFLRQRSGTNC